MSDVTTTKAMRDLRERTDGQRVKIILDREATASFAGRESRYEVQRLDGRGEIVRRVKNLSLNDAWCRAALECDQ